MNRRLVLFIQRRLPRYRVPVFEKLKTELSRRGFQLSLAHGQPTQRESENQDSGQLPWAIDAPNLYFRSGVSIQALPWLLIVRADVVVVPHEHRALCNFLVVLIRKVLRRTVAYFGHGDNFQQFNADVTKRFVRTISSRVADIWFCYTDLSRQRLLSQGVPESRIIVINNTTDTSELLRYVQKAAVTESVDAKPGAQEACRVVYIGSLHRHKRIEFLVQSAIELHRRIPELTVDIVGDGPERWRVEEAIGKFPWMRWHGHLSGTQMASVCHGARFVLNPGMVGLGIVDAFALGLPTITTNCGLHSPEIAYLKNGENGLITEDSLERFVDAAFLLATSRDLHVRLVHGCRETIDDLSLESMVGRFAAGFEQVRRQLIEGRHAETDEVPGDKESTADTVIVVLWQRYLDYHYARLRATRHYFERRGERNVSVIGVQVAPRDMSYGFAAGESIKEELVTVFPHSNYNDLAARKIIEEVRAALERIRPDLVLCPATAFPEGMAAVRYRVEAGCRVVIMDDAWEATDFRGSVTRFAKRLIHENVDGCFIPGRVHSKYFELLGFPSSRQIHGVDVVDNEAFAPPIDAFSIPRSRRFLFVGRLLGRKGVELLAEAYREYTQTRREKAWGLRVVGDGQLGDELRSKFPEIEFVGVKTGRELLEEYWTARCMVVPSKYEQWGLTVNEACASGLVVIASDTCAAALSLVVNGENGWTFRAGDRDDLLARMLLVDGIHDHALDRMGLASMAKVKERAPLDGFARGVEAALEIPRAHQASFASSLVTHLWTGWVRVR